MKPKFVTTSVLTAAAIAFGATATLQLPAQAQNIRFFCGFSSTTSLYTTYAQTPRGNVPVVRWYSSYFSDSGYTPERRCQEVSGRFQNLSNQGQLGFITTGIVNGLPVVCAGSGGGCNNSNLLFTLKAGQDAAAAVQQLFDLRATAGASGPLYESSDDDNSITIDLNNFLSNAAAEKTGSSDSAPAAAPSNSAPSNSAPTQPSSPGGGGLF